MVTDQLPWRGSHRGRTGFQARPDGLGSPSYRQSFHAGFTLIELLVVMFIMAVLASLLVAFWPSVQAQAREARGAGDLQGWCQIARQKAIRNQNPYGVRLF